MSNSPIDLIKNTYISGHIGSRRSSICYKGRESSESTGERIVMRDCLPSLVNTEDSGIRLKLTKTCDIFI